MQPKTITCAIIAACCLLLASCGRYITENGKASYYGSEYDGKKTASGKVFNKNKLTAAHKTLPFGTVVTVKNISNGKTVRVTITDRGPYVRDRIIDLSEKAASEIGMLNQGVAKVRLKYRKKKK
ncbi:MAG TPA: septal ring lytic transglycosylase RlpA family protein [Chitinophagaceae bacterium]|jgi:rare lipoprotein A|nr:septal ring lytic transglycosylase RlpA family protein [Chitinophagaceae bacterium]